ncbi:MAG TPA: DUF3618 domain-containing protein [Gemmatimonadales bacterium]|nr:DUF3618 domain-containing protein [Gemmatimonadales bacterium]
MTTPYSAPPATERLVEPSQFRVNWGAILAGLVVALALQIVLTLLGLAIGFTAWDPGDPARALGLGASIWWLVSGLVALFVGGMVVGRLAGPVRRKDGALHGIIMWGLSLVFGTMLVTSGIGRLLGGATSVLGRTVAAAAGAATGSPRTTGERIEREAERAQERLGVRVDTLGAQAREVAREATESLSTAAWLGLLSLGLGAGAAALGASRRRQVDVPASVHTG